MICYAERVSASHYMKRYKIPDCPLEDIEIKAIALIEDTERSS